MLKLPIKKPITKNPNQKNIKKANLGMVLEEMINKTNDYYLDKGIAVIHKKPIPIQIVNVNYPSRCEAVITEAYYKTPSTTDAIRVDQKSFKLSTSPSFNLLLTNNLTK